MVQVEYVGDREYYDFHVPETRNYWAQGVFHHNSGKSSIAKGISVAEEYIETKFELGLMYSGFKNDKEGSEDFSLTAKLDGRTGGGIGEGAAERAPLPPGSDLVAGDGRVERQISLDQASSASRECRRCSARRRTRSRRRRRQRRRRNTQSE